MPRLIFVRKFMEINYLRLAPLCMLLCLSLQACKKHPVPVEQPATATARSTESLPATPEKQAGPAAAPELAKAPEATFDFNTVSEAKGPVPPFPYVDLPPKISAGDAEVTTSPMDGVDVMLGTHLHRVEGRVTMRTFDNGHAGMSELELRRNYQNALLAFGAVKVNAEQGHVQYDSDPLMAKLRPLRSEMSYDVYLARKGATRDWVVVMTGKNATRLLSIEEVPFVQTVHYEGAPGKVMVVTATGAPPAAPQPLAIDTVPVTTAPLPPFPYLAFPDQAPAATRESDSANFDAVSFIVGKQLRTVEGKVSVRSFDNSRADLSAMAVQRNYEAAVKGLGAVRANTVMPDDPALMAASGDGMTQKLRLPRSLDVYNSYLLRTPDTNVWIALIFSHDRTRFVVVEEKAMQQSVTLVTADTMRTELAAKGHMPLYINFDTDKATIRPDGKPAVAEIATLLKNDPKLELSIEGHTDNSGDASHNLDLSRQRAESVVRQLVASGVDAARLQSAGQGAAKPIADNKDEDGRAKNRRVELVRL